MWEELGGDLENLETKRNTNFDYPPHYMRAKNINKS